MDVWKGDVLLFRLFCPTHQRIRENALLTHTLVRLQLCLILSFFPHMVSRSNNDKRCSFYDSLPVLDAWYPQMDKDRKHQSASPVSMPCPETTMSSRSSPDGRRCVSFSLEPPSVRYIGSNDEEEQAFFNEIHRKHGGNYRLTGVTRFCSFWLTDHL